MSDIPSSSAHDPIPGAAPDGAQRRRGRALAVLAGVAALLVLGAAGWARRDQLLEPWYVRRLESSSGEEREFLVERLTAAGSKRVVPVLLRWLVEAQPAGRSIWPAWIAPENLRYASDALDSPRLTPGLAAVVGDAAHVPAVRRYALELLARRRHPFEELEPALLEMLEDASDDLRREAALALTASLPDDPRPALRALDRALPAERSRSTRATLCCAVLLHCAQLPEEESLRWRDQAAAALDTVFAPWDLSAALGRLTAPSPERQRDPAKVALLASMRPRLETLLRRFAAAEDPALRQAAREALQFIERGERPVARAQEPR